MQCLFMEKIDFYSKYLEQIKGIQGRPKLLLHVCCGPCSTFPLKELSKYFDVTIFYSNSNIFPKEEYIKRKNELKNVINYYEEKGIKLSYVQDCYIPEEFLNIQAPFKNSPEGGDRCKACIKYRLKRTFDFAKQNGFDFFCSVMTVSQNKNAEMINTIGNEINSRKEKPIFLYTNFKKKGGLEEGIKIAKNLNLYRQNYCGCEISLNEMESRVLSKNCSKDCKFPGKL